MGIDWGRVDKLKKRVEYNRSQRDQDEEREKQQTARKRTIHAEPLVQKEMHFYCSIHGDFIANGARVEFVDNYGQTCGYFKAFGGAYFIDAKTKRKTFGTACPHGRRFITDKHLDPFYGQSKMLQRLRVEMADDLLQPGDPGFEAKYGDIYKDYNERMDADERIKWQNNNQR